ncbi:MAG: proline--tRNA ligase, partial [Deltaproteobacteria bacterium]|nr:proline--tRNA ligase [Deltaproteobacteria bacterium]
MMQDKKALQAATSHYFGTRFAEPFEIRFQDRDGVLKYVHQTTWGLSTRVIGALIMTHSDDQGLVLPPNAAPLKVVIVPILQKGKDNSTVLEVGQKIKQEIERMQPCYFDDRDEHSAGYKFHEWEVQGIPIRLEIGPRDVAASSVQLVRRDGKKKSVKIDQLSTEISKELADFQVTLLEKARKFMAVNTFSEDSYDHFKARLEAEGGFFQMHWCGSQACETKIKEETKATIRSIPFDQIKEDGKCVLCANRSSGRVIFARSY